MRILEQQKVFEEFDQAVSTELVQNFRPHIAGGHAELRRYSESSEQDLCALGAYTVADDETYAYPNKTAGAVVDVDYVQVHLKDALLTYYSRTAGAGTAPEPVSGYRDRILTNEANGFKANGATYPRIAGLYDRDVTVGDVVYLSDAGGTNTLTTTVAGFEATPVATAIGSSTAGTSNTTARPNSNSASTTPTVAVTGGGASGGLLGAGDYYVRYSFVGTWGETWGSPASALFSVSAGNIPRVTIPALPTGATSASIYLTPVGGSDTSMTLYRTGVTTTTTDLNTDYVGGGASYLKKVTQTAGTSNGVTATAVDLSSYNRLSTGDISETYTITVIQASTGTDLTTGRLQVVSASGRDDVASVTPSASGVATAIGTGGLTVTWTRTADTFVLGQVWQVILKQSFAVPTTASGGTYTGDADDTYTIRVSRGGNFADVTKPQITVTTSSGTDSSGPTDVTTSGAAVTVGTQGLTITFTGTQLNYDDVWTIAATGPTDGYYHTLILADNLSAALAAESSLTIRLSIKTDITPTSKREDSPPDYNWTADVDGVTTYAGVTATHSTLTDGGDPVYVAITGASVYVTYRAWLDTYADQVEEISGATDEEIDTAMEDAFGEADPHPDTGLPYAVRQALDNANGQTVTYSAIANPATLANWTDTLAILVGMNDIGTLVPLSRTATVWEAYTDHIAAVSGNDPGGQWRRVLFCPDAEETAAIVDATTSSNSAIVQARAVDNPDESGTQYTRIEITSANANLTTLGVAAGDIVRYQFTTDSWGDPDWTEYTVESVTNGETLILESGPGSAQSAQKIEIWRNRTKAQTVAALADSTDVNKRHIYFFPDEVTDNSDREVTGYFACAAYAGFFAGIAPHQGVRNVQIASLKATPRSTSYFNNAHVNTLAAAGFFCLSTAAQDGTDMVYAKFARTSDVSTTDNREEATGRLDDAVRYALWGAASQFEGSANAVPDLLPLVDAEVASTVQKMLSTKIDRIGPMIIDAQMDPSRLHLTETDRVVVTGEITRGNPVSTVGISLAISTQATA